MEWSGCGFESSVKLSGKLR